MDRGLVHIYTGDGKGKTTTVVGLMVRAASYEKKVLFYQFMKDNHSGERRILANIPSITLVDGVEQMKFTFRMTDCEKEEYKNHCYRRFEYITEKAITEHYDMIVMDEIMYAVRSGFIDKSMLLNFLDNKPESLEVVMSGNYIDEDICKRADYISEIKKVKHPFDKGIASREGIEY